MKKKKISEPNLSPKSLKRVFGILRRDDRRPLSLDEINEVIANGWAGKYDQIDK